MSVATKSAFTIIETMLFLSISGLVFVIGFIGVGSRLDQVRYTDSVRSLESDIRTSFRRAVDGVNLRDVDSDCRTTINGPVIDETGGDALGNDRDCSVAGIELAFAVGEQAGKEFTESALAIAAGRTNGSDFEIFEFGNPGYSDEVDFDQLLANATPIDSSRQTINTQWGLTYVGYKVDDAPLTPITSSGQSVRYLRHPQSNFTSIYYNPSGGSSFARLTTTDLYLCFETADGDDTATITITPDATVKANYGNGICGLTN